MMKVGSIISAIVEWGYMTLFAKQIYICSISDIRKKEYDADGKIYSI